VGYAFGGGWVEFTLHALSRNGNAHYTEEAAGQPALWGAIDAGA